MCILFYLWQHSDGLKMKKLRKVVHKALQESGIVVKENELSEALEQKVCLLSTELCFC
jgi:cell growth-regulating nucleolar protein